MSFSIECPWSDAVISHALDGAGSSVADRTDASECVVHLSECRICEIALARARRIDALVATSADSRVCDEDAVRWIDHAVALVAPRIDAPAELDARTSRGGVEFDQPTGARRRSLAVVGLSVAVISGWLWWASRSRPVEPDVAPPRASGGVDRQGGHPSVAEVERVDESTSTSFGDGTSSDGASNDGAIRLRGGSFVPSRSARRFGRTGGSDSTWIDVEVATAWQILWLEARARSARFGWSRSPAQLRRDADAGWCALRLDRLTELAELAVDSDTAFEKLVQRLSTWSGELRERGFEIVKATVPERRWLPRVRRSQLAGIVDVDYLSAAVQIGVSDRIDALARRRAIRVAADGPRFAQSLLGVQSRPGRARFLLGLWEDRCARGEAEDDLDAARRWFLGQPTEVVGQLLDVLSRSRDGEQRHRSLLALAAMRADSDGSVAAALDLVVSGASEEEALLAAFVLSRMDASAGGLGQRLLRRDYLRVAALVSRCDPRVRGVLDQLRMSDDVRVVFELGDLNEVQFRALAARCRSHAASDRRRGRRRAVDSGL